MLCRVRGGQALFLIEQNIQLRDLLPPLLPAVLCRTGDAARESLIREARLKTFSRHEGIASQGFEPLVVLVVRGHVGVSRSDPEGRRRMIRIAHRGDLISSQALRHAPAAAEDLVGLDRGVVALWPGEAVSALAAQDAGLAMDMLEHSLAGAARVAERLDRQSFDTVARRVAAILWQEQGLLFDTTRPLLSRPELADLAGATREMVDRVLRGMEDAGVVRRTGRSGLELRDAEALRQLAAAGESDPRDMEPCRREPLDEDALPRRAQREHSTRK